MIDPGIGTQNFFDLYNPDEYIKEVIGEERIRNQMTHRTFAKLAHISMRSSFAYESGEFQPDSRSIDRLSLALGAVPTYLPKEVYGIHPNAIGDGVVEIPLTVASGSFLSTTYHA